MSYSVYNYLVKITGYWWIQYYFDQRNNNIDNNMVLLLDYFYSFITLAGAYFNNGSNVLYKFNLNVRIIRLKWTINEAQ